MNFKEWLNESDDVKSQPETENPPDKPVDNINPFVAKLNKTKPQRTLSTNLPKYKENKWQLSAMKWKHRWLEGTYEL